MKITLNPTQMETIKNHPRISGPKSQMIHEFFTDAFEHQEDPNTMDFFEPYSNAIDELHDDPQAYDWNYEDLCDYIYDLLQLL